MKLNKKQLETILSALWFAEYKASNQGEVQRYAKLSKIIRSYIKRKDQ